MSPKDELRQLIATLLLPQLEQLVERLPDGLKDIRDAETLIRAGLLDIARLLLEAWSAKADKAVARPQCPDCKTPMAHRGHKETTVVTTLGPVKVKRPRWRCDACGVESRPHDEFLRFGEHGISLALAEVVARLGAQLPFDQARMNLRADYGVSLSKQTVQLVTEEAGGKVLAAEDQARMAAAQRREPLPEKADPRVDPAEVDTVVVSADGAMIHAEGDWREVRVAVASARSAAGRELVRASRARFLSVEDFAWQMVMLARRAGIQHARQKAFVADGAHWIWRIAETHFPGSVQILDWYHLAEHVHEAADALFAAGSAEAKAWAGKLKALLWEGGVETVLELLAEERKRRRSPAKRAAVDGLSTYLCNNRGRVDYPEYRRRGLPCGSGPVEAACKTLVGQRCKQSGMRNWTKAGAEGVLRLRAALADGEYARLWERRAA